MPIFIAAPVRITGLSSPEAAKPCARLPHDRLPRLVPASRWRFIRSRKAARSEEHTSELQSLMRISYAVFCLKKKKNNTENNTSTHSHTQSKNTHQSM